MGALLIEETDSFIEKFKTCEFTYQDENRTSKVLGYLELCRNENRFTDFNIKVGEQIFPCHKIVLEASCPYFQAFFSFNEARERGCLPSMDTLELQGISDVGMAHLLQFIYTSEVTITSENVIDILECADFLQFREIVLTCSAILLQRITTNSCLRIYHLANSHSLADLQEACWKFLLSNFEQVVCLNDFFDIPVEMFSGILGDKFLDVSNEDVLVRAVSDWYAANPETEESHVETLLESIKWEIVSQDIQISSDDLLKERILTFLSTDLHSSGEASKNTSRLTEVLLVVGRDTNPTSNQMNKDVLVFHPTKQKWEKLTELPFARRCLYSVAILDNTIYICGGASVCMPLFDLNAKDIFADNWTYSVATGGEWKAIQPLLLPRYNHSSANMKGQLYVVGGRSRMSLNLRPDGEVYDPKIDQWTKLTNILDVKGIGNAALVPLNGKLFLLGGTCCQMSHISKEILQGSYKAAQVYNPDNNEWRRLERLTEGMVQHVSIRMGDCHALDGFLLIVDDNPSGKYLKLYNPVTEELKNFVLPHGFHRFSGSVVFRGSLVCTGGVEDRFRAHDLVHGLNLHDSAPSWKMMPPLPKPLSHHACLTVFLRL